MVAGEVFMPVSDRDERLVQPAHRIASAPAGMARRRRPVVRLVQNVLAVACIVLFGTGCTSVRDYVRNGFKVGPEYCPASADVAPHWIDEADSRIDQSPVDLSQWWTVFNDPVLNRLVVDSCEQNLSLREAALRVLQARAQLGIASGKFFPQSQAATGAYQRMAVSGVSAAVIPDYKYQELQAQFGLTDAQIQEMKDFLNPTPFVSNWNFGFNLAWELDFWGRLRRAITAAEKTLEASAASYDQVLVTLLGDVATNYVTLRTLQKRMEYVQANVELQRQVLSITERRWQGGDRRTSVVDVAQTRATLAQTEAQIPQLKSISARPAIVLCTLLGMPPGDLERQLPSGPIPGAPPAAVVGIPADLLRRRADVRRAERQAAAQAEQIGIAKADLYPIVTINGSIGYQASEFSELFSNRAFNGSIGPSIQWNILHYGRIRNNVVLQNAKFLEFVTIFENLVLQANAEAENGMVRFLQAQEKRRFLDVSVENSQKAVEGAVKQYQEGAGDINRIVLIQQNLVQQQNLQADAHGQIALGLIQVYRALGGGWEAPPTIEEANVVTPLPAAPPALEPLPAPLPDTPRTNQEESPPPAPVPAPR